MSHDYPQNSQNIVYYSLLELQKITYEVTLDKLIECFETEDELNYLADSLKLKYKAVTDD